MLLFFECSCSKYADANISINANFCLIMKKLDCLPVEGSLGDKGTNTPRTHQQRQDPLGSSVTRYLNGSNRCYRCRCRFKGWGLRHEHTKHRRQWRRRDPFGCMEMGAGSISKPHNVFQWIDLTLPLPLTLDTLCVHSFKGSIWPSIQGKWKHL